MSSRRDDKAEERKEEELKKAEADLVEKKAAEAVVAAELAAKKEEARLLYDVGAQLALIERSAASKDPKAQARVLRQSSAIRRNTTAKAVAEAVTAYIPDGHPLKATLAAALAQVPAKPASPPLATTAVAAAGAPAATANAMEVDDDAQTAPVEKRTAVCMEAETYLAYLCTTLLLDAQLVAEAVKVSSASFARVLATNQRTLDAIGAKLAFVYARAHELAGGLASIRSTLLAAHRTSVLHHNPIGQVVLLNLLLRNYLAFNLYDQADKLVAKSGFPDSAPNNQLARYLFYLGRIKAIQLEYSESHSCLLQAARKAPQRAAAGFRLSVAKLTTIVQLLMGEIPQRSSLQPKQLERPLRPYLQIVQAVRTGDLAHFKQVMETHASVFHADSNHTLIVRLRQNVIRAGLRNINLAYTRISLEAIWHKLKIDRLEDVEGIVAKAIRDGVIDAEIDHAAGVLVSNEVEDLYATLEPQAAFHKRTAFCLNVHNEAVKAMSFPLDSHKGDVEEEEAKRKERQQEEAELAVALAEEDEEDFA
ncbi:PCI domain-containing protein [Pavlovales sp. CCMP2436]|nr:PCI domain-containing protein [Pavlovales sp. CCMP2436]